MVSESNGNFSTWNVFAKDGTPMTIRHIRRRDISQIWENFNQVVSENRYLPVYTPVIDEWEKKTWYEEITRGKNFCVVAEHQGLKKTQNIIGQCTIEDLQWEAASI